MSGPTERSKPSEEKPPVKWQRVQAVTLPTTAFRPGSIYTSAREMNKAVDKGTFDLNKTMALRNGRLYFLCASD